MKRSVKMPPRYRIADQLMVVARACFALTCVNLLGFLLYLCWGGALGWRGIVTPWTYAFIPVWMVAGIVSWLTATVLRAGPGWLREPVWLRELVTWVRTGSTS